MGACGEWAWFHPERGYSEFFCGSMSCGRQKCKKLFWSRRVRLITALIQEHGLKRFFTLTLERGKVGPNEDPWDYIHHPWSKFRKRMSRRYDFKFVAILESHKNKIWPHIHGFTDVWMNQVSWSDMWDQCGGGPVVWIEGCDNGDLSKYVSKQIEVARYVGKENLEVAYKERKGHRTLWRSKNLKAKYELTSSDKWDIVKEGVFVEGKVRHFFQVKLGVNENGKEE